MEAGLYLVGTPIGNLADVTLRALDVLRAASVILAEDTRVTRRLLARHGIATPLASCHRFNEAARAGLAERRIRAGGAVALVTDSGMPGVSDPGGRLAAGCRRAGLPVFVVPGPSAVTAAVALSGFGGGGFHFAGFPPRKSGARSRALERWLAQEVPAVCFESPVRLLRLLGELEALAPDRDMFVAREMTKIHEEGLFGTPGVLAERFRLRPPRGEVTLVIAPAPRRSAPRGAVIPAADGAAGPARSPG